MWSQHEPSLMKHAASAAQVCGIAIGLIDAGRKSLTTGQQLPNTENTK